MMMGLLFSNIAASAAILAIALIRNFLKDKVFSKVFVLLWILVIFRLLIPFEFSSGASIYAPIREQKTEFFINQPLLWEDGYEEFFVPNQKTDLPKAPKVQKTEISSEQILLSIWGFGAVFCGGFFVLRHRKNIKQICRGCVPMDDIPSEFSGRKICFYKSSSVASPLSFGIFRPVIIIPEDVSEKQLSFVLMHEQTHIKDHDAVLKVLALFALSLNWFNPAVWHMVKLFDRDLERYCDERVLSALGNEKAAFYANTILDFAERESLSLNFFSAASLCERVTSIMNNKKKKTKFLPVLLVFGAVVFIMTACGTLPETEEKGPFPEGNLSELISILNEQKEFEEKLPEEIDKLLEDYVEIQLENNSIAIVDLKTGETAAVVTIDPNNGNVVSVNKNPGKVINEIPEVSEELLGYYGDVPPNNYSTDSFSLKQIEKIEKISVSGFSFADPSSATVVLIPSNETYVRITYGDALRENGIYVGAENNNLEISVGTPCENIEEAFDLRIYGNFEDAEIDIENLGYSVYSETYERKHAEPPEEKYKPGDTLTYIAVEDLELQIVPPVENGYVAAEFGNYKGHNGMDIASEGGTGTEILAAAEGQVVKVKWDKTGYGYHVIINHGGGIQTLYAHLHDIHVELGQEVKAGETIGTMGSTGNSTGIHLHFELRINGEYTDPSEFITLP
ncbi:MAG: peptidoglycan DD-metalloendopeptidase family protein [Oscillospiraceae bacterium]|nr:peptidoglycan DD-metalloendopeptidase family protein [Oscillospiraceae bacterium]